MNDLAKAKGEKQEAEQQFIEFFRDVRGQFTRGRPTKIVLRHLRVTGMNDDIETWDDPEHFEGLEPGEFAKEIVERCQEEVKFLSGWQQYGIFFFRKGEKQKHDTRLRLAMMGEMDDDSGNSAGFGSEPANEAGRTGQIMRHDEAFGKLAFGMMTQAQNTLLKDNERLSDRLEKAEGLTIKTLEVLQNLLDRTAERDLKLERDKKMYGLMDEGLDKVMALAPHLIAAKVEKSNPELAAAIRKATANPVDDIMKAFLAELNANPEKANEIFARVMELPNGAALLQALQQLQSLQTQGK